MLLLTELTFRAAIWGLPGYTFLGIHKEARKLFGSSVENYVISARTAQGYEEFKVSSAQERLAIISRWKEEVQAENLKFTQAQSRKRADSSGGTSPPRGFFNTRHLPFEERKRLYEERKAKRQAESNKVQCQDGEASCPYCRRTNPHSHMPHVADTIPTISEPQVNTTVPEFEQAIRASVAATSRGNPGEDAMIERAIRASIRELQKDSGTTISDQDALNRAIQASISAAARDTAQESGAADGEDAEYQAILEKSIRDSLESNKLGHHAATSGEGKGTDNVGTQQNPTVKESNTADSDEDGSVRLAMRRSKEDHERLSAEEEIVMRYIKKQSLEEEALRVKRFEYQREQSQKLQGKGKELEAGESAADEEALQLAIKESLMIAGGGSASRSDETPTPPK